MSSFKVGRMSEDIKRELTDILRDIKDPRVDRMLTVVRGTPIGINCPTTTTHRAPIAHRRLRRSLPRSGDSSTALP